MRIFIFTIYKLTEKHSLTSLPFLVSICLCFGEGWLKCQKDQAAVFNVFYHLCCCNVSEQYDVLTNFLTNPCRKTVSMKKVNLEFILQGKKFLTRHEDLKSVWTVLVRKFANTAIYTNSVCTYTYLHVTGMLTQF